MAKLVKTFILKTWLDNQKNSLVQFHALCQGNTIIQHLPEEDLGTPGQETVLVTQDSFPECNTVFHTTDLWAIPLRSVVLSM
jgi:hypothetical protein